MKQEELQKLLDRQQNYFASGATLAVKARLDALRRLDRAIVSHESDIYGALRVDLGKSEAETDLCELGMVRSELHFMLRHTSRFARARIVPTPVSQFPGRSYTLPGPRGTVLILSPWNYPLMLALDPLIDALAAGNTVIVKPSAYAPATAAVLPDILGEAFDPCLAAVVTGGREENQALLHQNFDYIFFTGSQAVGKEVLRCAAEHLTPTALELGGKSPCIVDKTADLQLAARRIVFGKFLNCGQTCVAPDYVCAEESILRPLLREIRTEIRRQYGEDPLRNPDYGRIINRRHFERLQNLLEGTAVVIGGRTEPRSLRMEPTVVSPCGWESPLMQEEIFGPILPVIGYTDLSGLLRIIESRPRPLAFYLFSRDRDTVRRITRNCRFGGGCINDTIVHLATPHMGFGGVGESGMGSYHGKAGFEAFSHRKSIASRALHPDLPMRYRPYTPLSRKLVRFFLR